MKIQRILRVAINITFTAILLHQIINIFIFIQKKTFLLLILILWFSFFAIMEPVEKFLRNGEKF